MSQQQVAPPYPETLPEEGGSLLTGKVKLIVGLVVLAGALTYFGFLAFQSATVYYYTVSEIQEVGPTPPGKMVRVSGKLVQDSYSREQGSIVSVFTLTDPEGPQTLRAEYSGPLPDLFFNPYSNIILEGRYTSEGLFKAENIIVKCPSKYVGIDVEIPPEAQGIIQQGG